MWVAVGGREAGGRWSPAALAEALSTAFMVLPRPEVAELCQQCPEVEAWLVEDGTLESALATRARTRIMAAMKRPCPALHRIAGRNTFLRPLPRPAAGADARQGGRRRRGQAGADPHPASQADVRGHPAEPLGAQPAEAARPAARPVPGPRGVTNVAKGKKVTSSDMEPVIGEIEQVNDGDKKGADGSFVELGPGRAAGHHRPRRAARGVRGALLALPQDAARLLRRGRPARRRRRLHEERTHALQQRPRQHREPRARART